MIQDRHLIHGPLGLADVVGHQQHRRAVPGQLADRTPQVPASHRIDVVRGLIEHHHTSRSDRRHAETGQPQHAPGQLIAGLIHPLGNVQLFEQFTDPARDLLIAGSAHPGHQARDGARGQLPQGIGRLRLHRAQIASPLPIPDDVLTGHHDRALVRAEQPQQLVHQRRLAGPVVPEQPEHRPFLDVQGDVVVRHHPTVPGPVRLGDVIDLNQSHVLTS